MGGKKRGHVLDQTVSDLRPRRMVFFDTETAQREIGGGRILHTLRLGHAKYCDMPRYGELRIRDQIDFRTPGEFWEWFETKTRSRNTLYLIAHNLVFDLAIVDGLVELPEREWELSSFYSKDMISIFRWNKGDRRVMGLDNGNLFSGKLEKWGEIMGLPKMDVDFETVTDDELLTYCRRDVDIMVRSWETWIQFLDDNDCGAFKPTVASTAFNTWRHRFMDHRVYVHSDQGILDLERDAYRGGRCECFFVGALDDGPFYYLDINAMYGYVMRQFRFPAGLVGQAESLDPYYLAEKLDRYDVIARVTVIVDEPWLPMKSGTQTCYPVGEFSTVLTTPDLKLCIDRAWLLDVHQVAWYRSAPIFREYVDYFYPLRMKYEREGNKGYAEICKLFHNALYGKFGQRGFHQLEIGFCDPALFSREKVWDLDDGRQYWHVCLGGKVYREWQEGESFHSAPAIAAHVTAYARMYIYSLVRRVPPGHVFYMDTDSLLVDQVGYDALESLIVPGELGKLKIEDESPWVIIYAPKDYMMIRRRKMKGFSPKAVLVGTDVWRQTHFPGLRGLIKQGINRGYITQEVTKHPYREIYSGMVGSDGWIQPFHFQGERPLELLEWPPQPAWRR